MARRKKKAKYNPDKALLKNSIYVVKGAEPRKSKGDVQKVTECKASSEAMEKGKKMAIIEAYAKEHRISLTQAMIHFM